MKYSAIAMRLFRKNNFFRVFAVLFALFIFAGDYVADAVCDATDACAEQQSAPGGTDKGNCPAPSCAVQAGAVVMCDNVDFVPVTSVEVNGIAVADEEAPIGAPAAIEYPPQLA